MSYLTLPTYLDQPEIILFYQTWGSKDSSNKIVIVHELGGSSESFVNFAKHLSIDHFVIAFDQRCAGRSEKPIRSFSLFDLSNDLLRLLDALGIQEPINVMGLAMGAVVSVHFAISYPQRIKKLILCDGTSTVDKISSEYLLKRAQKISKEGIRNVMQSTLINSFKGLIDTDFSNIFIDYADLFYSNSPQCYAMHMEALANFNLSDEDFLKINIPTLVTTGENDVIWSPDVGEQLSKKIPNSKFEIIRNAAHFPPIQQSEIYAFKVKKFIN